MHARKTKSKVRWTADFSYCTSRKNCSNSSALQKIKTIEKQKKISWWYRLLDTMWNVILQTLPETFISLVINSGETFCFFPAIKCSCSPGKKFVSKQKKSFDWREWTKIYDEHFLLPTSMSNLSLFWKQILLYYPQWLGTYMYE